MSFASELRLVPESSHGSIASPPSLPPRLSAAAAAHPDANAWICALVAGVIAGGVSTAIAPALAGIGNMIAALGVACLVSMAIAGREASGG